ncbi:MAG TPA: phosphotransferase family protein, partial [Myxococcota bacterium]|nr:phosphotransferase family protein [Myxococcota bacterium]
MSAPESAGEVRGIDRPRVSEWLAANVAGARPPFNFELITGGHSNLTYQVTDAAGELFVLRRPPLGAVLATAHDMGREHRIIAALGRHTSVPVAPALGLCEDEAVNGAPFYVMKFVRGHVITDAATVARLFTPEQRGEIGASLIDVLARLHCVDPDAVGLGNLGRKDAYLPRQLNRWRTQWENSKTRELPAMEEVHEALVQMLPPQKDATIVHGDYRLGNCIT